MKLPVKFQRRPGRRHVEPILRLERLLSVIRRELGAEDAHVELGGRPPEGDRYLWAEIDGGARLVALLGAPLTAPAARAERLDRLRALANAFTGVVREAASTLASPASSPAHALEEELAALAERARAAGALVLGATEPVVWGSAHPDLGRPPHGVEPLDRLADALETAEAEAGGLPALLAAVERYAGHAPGASTGARPMHPALLRLLGLARSSLAAGDASSGRAALRRTLLAARGRGLLRAWPRRSRGRPRVHREPGFGCLTRTLLGTYVLMLVFEDAFDELHAEGAVRRARRRLERLLAALPPLDPSGRGARVIALPRR
jgi:hypothetical protein